MIKIKIRKYKDTFDLMYNNEYITSLSSVESLVKVYSSEIKEYPLHKDYFYISRDVISLNNKNGILCGKVEKNKFKYLYMSYMILHNKFEEFPDKSLIDLNEFDKYQFVIDITKSENIEIIPYIIHYRNFQKNKLTRIDNKNQIIDFKKDEKCRLTFKIIGYGKFDINKINIIPKG